MSPQSTGSDALVGEFPSLHATFDELMHHPLFYNACEVGGIVQIMLLTGWFWTFRNIDEVGIRCQPLARYDPCTIGGPS